MAVYVTSYSPRRCRDDYADGTEREAVFFIIFVFFCRGFGHRMAHSPMVIMWPSRDAEDGSYGSVTLSQRKAPYETMPTLDTDPPFNATLDLSVTSVRTPNR